jgi:pseudouridine synthase
MAIVRRGPQIKKFEKPSFPKKSRYKGKKNPDGTMPAVVAPVEQQKNTRLRQGYSAAKKDFAVTKTNKANSNYKGTKPLRPPFVKTPKSPAFVKTTARQASTLAPGLERLEKALAHMGIASRREAKDLIATGQVKVNGKIIREPGYGIKVGSDTVDVKGEALQGKETVLVYKPRGLETNKTAEGVKDLHDYFPKLRHLSPIGRLDKDSEGLIIMSNDGSLARALTQENSHVAKTYEVTVRENVTDDALKKMSTGILLTGSSSDKSTAGRSKIKTKPAEVKRLSRMSFSIVLHEGRKHQIRRMCDACHLNVEELLRTKIGHLSIGSMKPGSMRNLIQDDIEKLKG